MRYHGITGEDGDKAEFVEGTDRRVFEWREI